MYKNISESPKAGYNTILIVFGVPGSGKSTLSTSLYEQFIKQRKVIIIEADSYEMAIHQQLPQKEKCINENDKTNFTFNEIYWNESRQLVLSKVKDLLQEATNTLIIVDDDFLLRSQRKNFYSICKQSNTSYVEILLDLPFEQIQERNSQRTSKKQLDEDVLKQFFLKIEKKPIKKQLQINFKSNHIQELENNIKEVEIISQEIYKQELVEQNQIVCQQNNENLIHMVDIILRKGINIIMKSRDQGEFMQQISTILILPEQFIHPKKDIKYLTQKRNEVLDCLRGIGSSNDQLQQLKQLLVKNQEHDTQFLSNQCLKYFLSISNDQQTQ